MVKLETTTSQAQRNPHVPRPTFSSVHPVSIEHQHYSTTTTTTTTDVCLLDAGLRVCRAAGADADQEARERGVHQEPAALHGRLRVAVGVGAAARGVPPLRQERVRL